MSIDFKNSYDQLEKDFERKIELTKTLGRGKCKTRESVLFNIACGDMSCMIDFKTNTEFDFLEREKSYIVDKKNIRIVMNKEEFSKNFVILYRK